MSQVKTRAADIRREMIYILRKNPKGLVLKDLIRKIQTSLPGVSESRIRGVVWQFSRRQAEAEEKGQPPKFVQPEWGFYRIRADGQSGARARPRVGGESKIPSVGVEIQHGNAIAMPGDVLVVKYAQKRYGLDKLIAGLFTAAGRALPKPNENEVKFVKGVAGIKAERVLVVGMPDLWMFDYSDIQNFGRLALSGIANVPSPIRRVLMTIHGTGFGLDGIEALGSEIAGLQNAVRSGQFPRALESVSIVESTAAKAAILEGGLRAILPDGGIVKPAGAQNASAPDDKIRRKSKKSIFVAMPFKRDMEDLYHYGIVGGVHAAGFVCERADMLSFTGDVVQWIRHRIEKSAYVIAILTGANPNVYLEVGYAWKCGIPCLLLARNREDIKFDVSGQRCIFYDDIRDLESKLARELRGLEQRL